MKWSSSEQLLLLVALCGSYIGIWARDPRADQWEYLSALAGQVEVIYRQEMSSGATSEEVLNMLHTSTNEVIKRAGFEAINLANNLQTEITESAASFVETVGSALGDLQSFLYTMRNMYRSQALQDAMWMLTELNAAILDLQASLDRINGQQANSDQWELETAQKWKLWSGVLVENVGRSTEGTGTSMATNITQSFRTRFDLRLHACQEEYIWSQTRYNLKLQEALENSRNSTDFLIQATLSWRHFRTECHIEIRKALSGLVEVPGQLDRLRDQAEHLLVVREDSNQCMWKVLEQYNRERVLVQSQLQDIIEVYES